MGGACKLIASSKYSNIPVYKDKELIGIANGQKILDAFGTFLLSGGKSKTFLENVQIEDMLSKIQSIYYEVASTDLTMEEGLNEFHKNPKLLAILLKKIGDQNEPPLGIVTGSDAIEMNKVLDSFN